MLLLLIAHLSYPVCRQSCQLLARAYARSLLSHLEGILIIHVLCQGDDGQGSKGESGSFDDPHDDMNLGQFNDLVQSNEQRQQLSMYNKRHKS